MAVKDVWAVVKNNDNNIRISICDKNESTKEELIKLWSDIFHDTEEFIRYYFDNIFQDNKVIGLTDNGKLVGMVHMNPYYFSNQGIVKKTYYIVAVAVDEKYRNHGYMRDMMRFAFEEMKKENLEFTYLWPADVRYYLGLGFEKSSTMIKLIINYKDIDKCREYLSSFISNAKSENDNPKDTNAGKISVKTMLYMPVVDSRYIELMNKEAKSEGGEHYSYKSSHFTAIEFNNIIEVSHVICSDDMNDLFLYILKTIEKIAEKSKAKYELQMEISIDELFLTEELFELVNHKLISLSEDYIYMIKKFNKDGKTQKILFTEIV